eukprot:5321171-Pyramimonas_sp.AAC.1
MKGHQRGNCRGTQGSTCKNETERRRFGIVFRLLLTLLHILLLPLPHPASRTDIEKAGDGIEEGG